MQVQLLAGGAEVEVADAQVGLAGKVPKLAPGKGLGLRGRQIEATGGAASLPLNFSQGKQLARITQFARLFDQPGFRNWAVRSADNGYIRSLSPRPSRQAQA